MIELPAQLLNIIAKITAVAKPVVLEA